MNTVYVIGIGPGNYDGMTLRAQKALEECEVIAGYTVYVDLIKGFFPDKEIITTPMKQETDRCRLAFEKAREGKRVAMVCSGDAGIYGMAGLMVELSKEYPDCKVTVIPGVTAAVSGGAVLGAPLAHDFAFISLSDLLTPWDTIEKRLRGAAMADFVISIYNPSSKKRQDYLKRACDIILKYAKESTVCGVAANIGRPGETVSVMDLKTLREQQVDMFTTVIIGNSQTKVMDGRMVTPRGYLV